MAGVKGRSGTNKGLGKPWRDAINVAVSRTAEDGKTKRLALLAEQLVKQALAGDTTALKEIGDRLDGKPAQSIIGDDDAAPIRHIVEWAKSSGS